jgi:hypothetical protein
VKVNIKAGWKTNIFFGFFGGRAFTPFLTVFRAFLNPRAEALGYGKRLPETSLG